MNARQGRERSVNPVRSMDRPIQTSAASDRRRSGKVVLLVLLLLLTGIVPTIAQSKPVPLIAEKLDSIAAHYFKPVIVVAFGTFTYEYTGLGSSYSRYIEDLLSQAVASSRKIKLFVRSVIENMDPDFRELYRDYFKTTEVDALLYGRFFNEGKDVRIDLRLTSLTTGQLIGTTSIAIPENATPRDVSLVPPGLGRAADMRSGLTNLVGSSSGDLVVKATTSRGDGATFTSGENLLLHVFVNRDAYVKVYHIDANGNAQLIFPNRFQANNLIPGGTFAQIPADGDPFKFQLGPPFGIEFVKVIASTTQFKDMEQPFSDLGKATRSLLTRGLQNTDPSDSNEAEALVSYSIVAQESR